MASNEILAGRFGGILTKTFNTKEGTPSPTLGPEIIPVFCVENDRPEFHFLGGVHLCAGHAEQTAQGASNNTMIGLRNPANSNIIAVVTEITLHDIVGGNNDVGLTVQPITGGGSAYGFDDLVDTRWVLSGAATRPMCQVRIGSIGGPTAPTDCFDRVRYGTTISLPYVRCPVQVVLAPNSWCTVWDFNANSAKSCSFKWYERAMNESETR